MKSSKQWKSSPRMLGPPKFFLSFNPNSACGPLGGAACPCAHLFHPADLQKGAAGYRKLQIHLSSLEGNTWDLGFLSLKKSFGYGYWAERAAGKGMRGRAEALSWLWSSGLCHLQWGVGGWGEFNGQESRPGLRPGLFLVLPLSGTPHW